MSTPNVNSEMSASDIAAMKLAVAQFLENVEQSSDIEQNFLNNPVATLQTQGIPLPNVDPTLTDAFNQTYQNIITPPGSSRKRSFDWYGTADSVACWSCSITLNTAIWAAITAGTIAAVVVTNGAILGPAYAVASGMTAVQAAAAIATASATLATGSFGGAVAVVGLPVALAAFINAMVTEACNAIPNCCSGAEPTDNGMWNQDNRVGATTTSARPGFAALDDGSTLMTIYRDSNTSKSWIWYRPASWSGSQFSWGDSAFIINPVTNNKCLTNVGPAVTALGNTFYCVYIDIDPEGGSQFQLVCLYSTDKGKTWLRSETNSGQVSPSTPALTVFQGNLYCAYIATGEEGSLNYMKGTPNPDGSVNWSNVNSSIGPVGGNPYQSSVEPGLGSFQGKLICMYKRSSDNGLRYTYSTDGANWSAEAWLPDHLISCGPALGSLGNMLVCLYIGPNDTNLRYSTSNDGVNWTIEYRCDSNLTSVGPALASAQSRIYALYGGGTNNYLHWTSNNS